MEQRIPGRTGVPVNKLCLGAMTLGEWGTQDHDESTRIIHRDLEVGIDFIDTADVYSAGESEEIVGKALADGRRDDVFLATKVGFPMGDDPRLRGASRRRIVEGAAPGDRRRGRRDSGADRFDLAADPGRRHRADPGHPPRRTRRGEHRRGGRRPDLRSVGAPRPPGLESQFAALIPGLQTRRFQVRVLAAAPRFHPFLPWLSLEYGNRRSSLCLRTPRSGGVARPADLRATDDR